MLTLIKVTFKEIIYSDNINIISFSDFTNKLYNITLNKKEIILLEKTIDLLKNKHNKDSLFIAYHDDFNNIPFIILNNKIVNFSEDSIYKFKNNDKNYAFKTLGALFGILTFSLIITLPVSFLLSLVFVNHFFTILFSWEFFLAGFSTYFLLRNFKHYSFVKRTLYKNIKKIHKDNLILLECHC